MNPKHSHPSKKHQKSQIELKWEGPCTNSNTVYSNNFACVRPVEESAQIGDSEPGEMEWKQVILGLMGL